MPGFATLTRTGLQLLVGQQLTVNLTLSPAAMSEAVTVTADAPLIDRTNSTVGSNVDPRQMAELPLNGRNFVDLTHARAGQPSERLDRRARRGLGTFQLNVDGLRVTQNQTGGLRPAEVQPRRDRRVRVRREPLRRDAGRLVAARWSTPSPSRARTSLAGTFSGYFRDD